MAIVGKSTTDNLYYLTVHGTTEVMSEGAAMALVDNLTALICSHDEGLAPEPENNTKH